MAYRNIYIQSTKLILYCCEINCKFMCRSEKNVVNNQILEPIAKRHSPKDLMHCQILYKYGIFGIDLRLVGFFILHEIYADGFIVTGHLTWAVNFSLLTYNLHHNKVINIFAFPTSETPLQMTTNPNCFKSNMLTAPGKWNFSIMH